MQLVMAEVTFILSAHVCTCVGQHFPFYPWTVTNGTWASPSADKGEKGWKLNCGVNFCVSYAGNHLNKKYIKTQV